MSGAWSSGAGLEPAQRRACPSSSRVAGEPYQNQFAQFLTLRWGKVTEDVILEDTATWEDASRRLAAAGDTEAAGPPLTATPA